MLEFWTQGNKRRKKKGLWDEIITILHNFGFMIKQNVKVDMTSIKTPGCSSCQFMASLLQIHPSWPCLGCWSWTLWTFLLWQGAQCGALSQRGLQGHWGRSRLFFLVLVCFPPCCSCSAQPACRTPWCIHPGEFNRTLTAGIQKILSESHPAS